MTRPNACPASTPSAVRAALARDGFSLVTDAFGADDIQEARSAMDAVLARGMAEGSALRAPGGRMVVQDMAAPGLDGVDQLEILYPATLDPRLLETRLFAKAQRLAQAIAGPMMRSFDHVIVKPAGNRTATHWHQDIALSRLDRLPRWLFRNRLHFWIPLQPVTVENGCMEFIAGSHRGRILPHRATRQASGGSGFAADPGDDERTACPVPLGGLTIHTPWTLHYTAPNRGPDPRVAWIVHFSPTGAIEIALKRAFGRLPERMPRTRHGSLPTAAAR